MKKQIVTGCLLTAALLPLSAQLKLQPDNLDEVIGQMTLEEKVHLVIGTGAGWSNPHARVPGMAGSSYAIPRLGIPETTYADSPHGLKISFEREYDSHRYYTTEFPISTALAATWNPESAYEVGQAIGNECKEYGIDILLAPGINLHRNVLGGRNQEYFSEDPLISGKLGAAYINGVQSQGVGTSLKHFAANNQDTNRKNNDSRVSQRALRELYLKSFEIAVKESRPWTVMSAYNYINGIHAAEHKELLTDVLRNEWGFQGMVMSDWDAGTRPVESMKAGNDVMEPGTPKQYEEILAAAKDGSLPMEALDANVKRILQMVVKTPAFKGYVPSNEPDLKAHSALARKVGAESMVLLKNERQTLPLTAVSNVALYGATSYNLVSVDIGVGGNSAIAYTVSLIEGLRKAGLNVDKSLLNKYKAHISQETKRLNTGEKKTMADYLKPAPRPEELEWKEADLQAQAAANDVALVTIGRVCGETADRYLTELSLYPKELALLRQVSQAYHAAGKKVVVLLNVCGPMWMSDWSQEADAILCTWIAGVESGNAMTDVLTGKVNPSGRLPMTWPLKFGDSPSDRNITTNHPLSWEEQNNQPRPQTLRKDVDYTTYEEGIYVGYRYFETTRQDVAYPFGYGLSYTTFDYSDAQAEVTEEGGFDIKVTVTNTGKRVGREVVQLYVTAPKGGLEKPGVELKAFGKTRELAPGESQQLSLKVSAYDLASFHTAASQWVTAKGTYQLKFGKSSRDIRLTIPLVLKKSKSRKVGNVLKPEKPIREISLP